VARNVSDEARKYLWEVWKYLNPASMDDQTAECVCENVRDNPGDWVHDVEIWEAFKAAHPERAAEISKKYGPGGEEDGQE
jgi:hypothetical protein